jgi:hypothetical protein
MAQIGAENYRDGEGLGRLDSLHPGRSLSRLWFSAVTLSLFPYF